MGFEEGLNSETGSEEFRAFVLGWESICTWSPDGFVLKFLFGSLTLFFSFCIQIRDGFAGIWISDSLVIWDSLL